MPTEICSTAALHCHICKILYSPRQADHQAFRQVATQHPLNFKLAGQNAVIVHRSSGKAGQAYITLKLFILSNIDHGGNIISSSPPTKNFRNICCSSPQNML